MAALIISMYWMKNYHADIPMRLSRAVHRGPGPWLRGLTPQWAWVLLLEGGLELRYEDQPGCWRLGAGDCLQRMPERPHAIRFLRPTVAWSLAVPAAAVQALCQCGLHLWHEPVLHPACDAELLAAYEGLAERFRRQPVQRRAELLPACLELVVDLLRRHGQRHGDGDPWERACRRLAADLALPIDLRSLAEELGMDYDRFRLGFRRRYGCPPGRWRVRRRIERACDLLRDGLGVRDCAEVLGYCDSFAFSRQFKAQAGVPPSKWREVDW